MQTPSSMLCEDPGTRAPSPFLPQTQESRVSALPSFPSQESQESAPSPSFQTQDFGPQHSPRVPLKKRVCRAGF